MSTPDPAPTPTEIAGYRIDRVLAAGGMGAVYAVHSPSLPRREALKILSAELATDPRMRTRFLQEADITASLDHHRNIVQVFTRGETDDGQLWIAMEYVDGTDAETALQAGTITPQRAMHITTEVARALDHAHRRGVVHQDIKPSNFLLGEQPGEPDRVVLSDFGAAVTPESADPADGPMTASLAYAAPEVLKGETIDGRADVYSLGCTLFRLLTGMYPFPSRDDVPAMIRAHLGQPPPRVSEHSWVTPQLDHVIAKALTKDPDRRYRTAGEFAAAAAAALNTGDTAPPSRPAAAQELPRGVTPPPPKLPANSPAGTASAAVDFIGHLPHTHAGPSKRYIRAGAAAAAALVAIGLTAWLVLPTSPSRIASSTTATPTDPTAAAKLAGILPSGYSTGICTPAIPNSDLAASAVSCGPNADPGGPPTATYTLARNRGTLQALFGRKVATATAVLCPGNIQSPVLCPTGVSKTVWGIGSARIGATVAR